MEGVQQDPPLPHQKQYDHDAAFSKMEPLIIFGLSLVWATAFTIAYSFVCTPVEIFSMTEVKATRVSYLAGIFIAQLVLYVVSSRGMQQEKFMPAAISMSVVFLLSMSVVAVVTRTGINHWIAVGAIVLAGSWQGIFHVLWSEVLVQLYKRDAYKTVFSSVTLGAFIFIAAVLAFRNAAMYATFAFVLLSLLSYRFVLLQRPEQALSDRALSRKDAKYLQKSNITLMVYGSVFGIGIYAAVINSTAPSYVSFAFAGLALIAGSAPLLLFELVRNHHFELNVITLALLPFVALALLALFFANLNASWCLYLILLALLTAFDSTAFTFNIDITRELQLCPIATIARGRIYVQGGMFIAGLIYFMLTTFIDGFERYSYVVPLALVFMLFMLVTTCGKLDFFPTSSLVDASPNAEPASQKAPVDAARIISDDYDLSKREYDVLRLLITGHSISSIAENLVVSQNTVKSHVYHIYRKMAVNSKQEVIDIRDRIIEEYSNHE